VTEINHELNNQPLISASAKPGQTIKIKVVGGLKQELHLSQVQNLLQHALDHDGYLPIGEHIYLKLKVAHNQNFLENLVRGEETAGALLAYLEGTAQADHELYPEHSSENGHRLVGYAQLLAQPHNHPSRLLAEMVVHPHLRGQGIGRRLLDNMLELAKLGNFDQLDMWAYHASSPAHTFANHVTLKPTRVLHHLRRPIDLPLPAYQLPPDLHLRTFRPGEDDQEWLVVNNHIFAGHPENGSWTQADLENRFVQPWFDPQDFLIIEDQQGKIVAFNWTKRHPARFSTLYRSPAYPEIAKAPANSYASAYSGRMGEIYVVGLHPAVRGRGMGRGLTLLGLHSLQTRGCDFFGLYVDATNTAAVKLYHSLGFSLHHDDISYSYNLKHPE
jgi:mycothiol synthase